MREYYIVGEGFQKGEACTISFVGKFDVYSNYFSLRFTQV